MNGVRKEKTWSLETDLAGDAEPAELRLVIEETVVAAVHRCSEFASDTGDASA